MKKHILIVDDEASIRELCKELLEDEGYVVTLAENGEDALKKAEREIFDLYLLDMAMPRMSGYELMKEIKTKQPLAVIIILTGFSSIEGAVEATHAGAYRYLSKPINAEELFRVVKAGLQYSEDIYGPLQKAFDPGTDTIHKGEPIILHGFSPEDKLDFMALGIVHKYESGDDIPLGQEDSGSILILESGEISMWLNNNIVDYLQKWDTCGEESFILAGSTFTKLRAETAVKLRHFDRKQLMDFFAFKGERLLKRFMINLINSAFFKWRKALQRIVMLKLMSGN
ncbi:MAG TPA: response regulator [Candidatus Cloacimonadota bacterium]|nr:response regulator [Candidatus Cloacimonadota bacterium]